MRIAACVVMLLCLGLPAPVAAQSPLAITTRALPRAVAGTPYSFTLTATGGTPPYTWSGARQTPDNSLGDMSLDADTGELFGTPAFSGIMPMILDVTDDTGAGATIQFDFVVTGAGSPHSFVNAPPNGTQGTPYDFQFVMSWDVPPFPFCGNMSFIGGGLPPGLGINPLMGRMTGTPLVAGEYTFTLSSDGVTTACSGSEPTQTNAQTFTVTIAPSGPVSSPPGGSGWVRHAGNPVLRPSTSGWDGFLVSSPSVVKAGDTFVMYYEGEHRSTHRRAIGRATSPDGITWTKAPATPVLSPGAAGAWDSRAVRYPTVHFDGTTYRMWYWGSGTGCNRIGLATSADGITWTKSPSNPLAVGSCNFADNKAPGSVIQRNGTFTMFYWIPLNADFGRATSTNGVTWTDRGSLDFELPIGVEASGVNSLSRPVVVVDGSTLRMWFNMHRGFVTTGLGGGFDLYREHVGYASSANGTTWDVLDDDGFFARVFGPGRAGRWDRPGVGQAWVLKDSATWHMWYTGGRTNLPLPDFYAFTEGSIGLATTPGANARPGAPTTLRQFRSNGTTAVAIGGTIPHSTVVLKATVSDPDGGQSVKLQVELRRVGTSFRGAVTHESALVPSGRTPKISVTGLANGSYHWRARATDSLGKAGAWTAFGGNGESVADFTVKVPPKITIAATDATAKESGSNTGQFTVTRTGSTAAPLTVFYAATGTALAGTDYVALPGSVTIPAGALSAPVTITAIDDTRMEGPETVVLTLSGRSAYTVGAPGSATVKIVSDEQVTITAPDATATEAGLTTGRFSVKRTGGRAVPLTVFYTVGGTAGAGADYQALPGSVTIPAGATAVSIRVTPINDALVEGAETVVVTLRANAVYTLGTPKSATVTIVSNE